MKNRHTLDPYWWPLIRTRKSSAIQRWVQTQSDLSSIFFSFLLLSRLFYFQFKRPPEFVFRNRNGAMRSSQQLMRLFIVLNWSKWEEGERKKRKTKFFSSWALISRKCVQCARLSSSNSRNSSRSFTAKFSSETRELRNFNWIIRVVVDHPLRPTVFFFSNLAYRIMCSNTMDKNWAHWSRTCLRWPKRPTEIYGTSIGINRVWFQVNRAPGKRRRRNSCCSICARWHRMCRRGCNSKFWKRTPFWRRSVSMHWSRRK